VLLHKPSSVPQSVSQTNSSAQARLPRQSEKLLIVQVCDPEHESWLNTLPLHSVAQFWLTASL
jgi:hypothetical protein